MTAVILTAMLAPPMSVDARYEGQGRPAVTPGSVGAAAERMLLAMGLPHAELSILLCDDPTMRALNSQYRGQDRPTDVLAFAMMEGEPGPGSSQLLLGDVVISIQTAAAQAHTRGHSLHREVLELLGHGLLHLLGFDHPTGDDERRMRARTDLLIAAAGQLPVSVENPVPRGAPAV